MTEAAGTASHLHVWCLPRLTPATAQGGVSCHPLSFASNNLLLRPGEKSQGNRGSEIEGEGAEVGPQSPRLDPRPSSISC